MILRGYCYSAILEMETPVSFVLPDRARGPGPRKVVYLLHGLRGRSGDWIDYTMLPTFARRYDALFVLPDVARSFYADMEFGQRFFSYVADELPEIVAESFAGSARREDNLVMGASMGGYGALKLAFSRPERYGACAAFSPPCLFLKEGLDYQRANEGTDAFRAAFGDRLINDFHAIFGPGLGWKAECELLELAKRLPAGSGRPSTYLACGSEDGFAGDSRRFSRELRELGLDPAYEEWAGAHDFEFFSAALGRALARFLGGGS